MSYCLNPNCQKPQNVDESRFCQNCGFKLMLRERYRALKRIGEGGFGKTLLAVDEDKPSKPPCVIKQFLPQIQVTNAFNKAIQLFKHEAVRLDELGKHPQIPELLAYFEQDKFLYLVQEFIDGENLAEELETEGVFKETQIRELLSSLLPVLQFMHEHQVIHRDIKPENIIRRRRDRQFVLVDFGASRLMTGTALFKTGTLIGTPGYAAPEQLDGRAVFVSDLYSLGVTCLLLTTQVNHPWDLRDAEGIWVWRDYLADNSVSDGLGRILDKMVQKETKQRYQSAVEVLQDLNPSVVSSVSSPSSPVQSVAPPVKKTSPVPQRSVVKLEPLRENRKYGYKDEKEQGVIQFQFDDAWRFSEGLARVKIGNKYGYIAKTGQMVILPQFDGALVFSNGKAEVYLKTKLLGLTIHGRWRTIDKTGQFID